jgi:hypothetical protein
VILATHAGIHKFNFYLLSNTLQVPVPPGLEWERGGLSPAFFLRTHVLPAGWMRIDFVCRTIHDVHLSAIRAPARNPGGEMLIGIRDAPVMLFFEFVFYRVRGGVAPQPELLDELVPFFIVGQLLECRPFLVGDDVADVLVQPLLVSLADFFPERLLVFSLLLLAKRSFERIYLLLLGRWTGILILIGGRGRRGGLVRSWRRGSLGRGYSYKKGKRNEGNDEGPTGRNLGRHTQGQPPTVLVS